MVDSLELCGEFKSKTDRINYITFLIHSLEKNGKPSTSDLELMLHLRREILKIDGNVDKNHLSKIKDIERALSNRYDREHNVAQQAAKHAKKPAPAEPTAVKPQVSQPESKTSTIAASTGAKVCAVGGVLVSGVDTAYRAKQVINNPNVVNSSRLAISTARTGAAVRHANKVFTKGIASTTAKRVCAVAGVAVTVLDCYENITDTEMVPVSKVLACELDIIAGALCFMGPIGIIGGVGLGIVNSVWIKPALRTVK